MHCTSLHLSDGTPVARLWLATGPRERMRGLLGRASLPAGELLLLDPCGSIHTFGMRFALDVVFVDRNWRVVGVRCNVRPGRIVWGGWRAHRTLEAATGWLALDALRAARFAPPAPAAPDGSPP